MKLIVGDKCLGMLEAVGEVFPEAKYQCCTVHFYRNVFSVVPKSKVKLVVKMLKAVHAQEHKKAAREKASAVVAELRAISLRESADKVEAGAEETLTYFDFPNEYWTKILTTLFPLIESTGKNLLKLYLNDVGILTGILFGNNIRVVLEMNAASILAPSTKPLLPAS